MKVKKTYRKNVVRMLFHILPYASLVTNDIFLLRMFAVTHRKTSIFYLDFLKV